MPGMKIEKISNNQIRCTLTREDLAQRRIRLSELAYGSEKARALFRELMLQAEREVGFEINNIPIMVEAIPLSTDALILVITKVEDPDELDTRFSRFSPDEEDGEGDVPGEEITVTGADEILNLIQKIHQARGGQDRKEKQDDAPARTAGGAPFPAETADAASGSEDDAYQFTRFYLFHDLDTVIHAARVIGGRYDGPNALFRNPDDRNYYLLLKKAGTPDKLFNSICNILSEYALPVSYTPGMEEFFTEHMEVVLAARALQQLAWF